MSADFPLRQFTTGIFETTPFRVSGEYFGAKVILDIRDMVDPRSSLRASLLYSDDGQDWKFGGGGFSQGGPDVVLQPAFEFATRFVPRRWAEKDAEGHRRLLSLDAMADSPFVKLRLEIVGTFRSRILVVEDQGDPGPTPDIRRSIGVLNSVFATGTAQTVTTAGIDSTGANLLVWLGHTGVDPVTDPFSDNQSSTVTNQFLNTTTSHRCHGSWSTDGNTSASHTGSVAISGNFNTKLLTFYAIGDAAAAPATQYGSIFTGFSTTLARATLTGVTANALLLSVEKFGSTIATGGAPGSPWTQTQGGVGQDYSFQERYISSDGTYGGENYTLNATQIGTRVLTEWAEVAAGGGGYESQLLMLGVS